MLYVVATPIGNWQDITERAREILKSCDLVIGEEHRLASTILKKTGVTTANNPEKPIYLLNEHSKPNDVKELCDLCATKNVALISDCGTPGFADPGPALVKMCRDRDIPVTALPGASALTTILSLTSEPIRSFVFYGFLPQDSGEREKALREIERESKAWIVMDTPYRLLALLELLAAKLPKARVLLGMNLTQDSETILEGTLANVCKKVQELAKKSQDSTAENKKKFTAEFMLLKYGD